ncbi:hypothetical protein [Sinomonas gamaensis]|jgi:hypothetical protein|uniref:hypothetical protein n=1 Tax=Sinomonas gamaensis TaxID=2565624 RepID=UPI0011081445|nr:hypothetical protein [Sinomonas gamaensis]
MAEMLAATDWAEHVDELAPGDSLGDQVVGILREVLEGPGLCEASKVRLRRLLIKHRGHPERALLEHFREMGVQPKL